MLANLYIVDRYLRHGKIIPTHNLPALLQQQIPYNYYCIAQDFTNNFHFVNIKRSPQTNNGQLSILTSTHPPGFIVRSLPTTHLLDSCYSLTELCQSNINIPNNNLSLLVVQRGTDAGNLLHPCIFWPDINTLAYNNFYVISSTHWRHIAWWDPALGGFVINGSYNRTQILFPNNHGDWRFRFFSIANLMYYMRQASS